MLGSVREREGERLSGKDKNVLKKFFFLRQRGEEIFSAFWFFFENCESLGNETTSVRVSGKKLIPMYHLMSH